MEKGLRERLKRQIRVGRAVLFTGAGFSLAAKNKQGRSLPSVSTLKAELWRVAYPSGTKPDASSLGDLYASAVQRAQGSVGRLVRSEFAVAHADVPDVYKLWFSVPWYRIYTLNLDDLEEAADVRFSFPRTIRSVSALLDGVQSGEGLDSVHLTVAHATFQMSLSRHPSTAHARQSQTSGTNSWPSISWGTRLYSSARSSTSRHCGSSSRSVGCVSPAVQSCGRRRT